MNQNGNDRIRDFTQAIEQVPEKYRGPALFIAKHYDFFEEMCRVESLTEKQREEYMDDAIRKDDTMMILLLCMERRINSGTLR